MSDVVNKTTLQYKRSVHTPDYPATQWLINPVVPDCAQKYWKVKGDKVLEMLPAEKNEVDVLDAAAAKEALKEILISDKAVEISRVEAIQALKDDGVLDANGEIIGG